MLQTSALQPEGRLTHPVEVRQGQVRAAGIHGLGLHLARIDQRLEALRICRGWRQCMCKEAGVIHMQITSRTRELLVLCSQMPCGPENWAATAVPLAALTQPTLSRARKASTLPMSLAAAAQLLSLGTFSSRHKQTWQWQDKADRLSGSKT